MKAGVFMARGRRRLLACGCLALLAFPALAQRQQREIVLSYHPQASEIGLQVLRSGGNAFDAFVAATMAEYVLAEGGTSMAGLVGAVLYNAGTRKLEYLDADYNRVADPAGMWNDKEKKIGKAVPVSGAIAGLEALAKRHGSKPFGELLQPAIKLARDGFPIGNFYAAMIAWRADALKNSEYGRRTYFPKGKALAAGDLLRQPEVADLLTNLQKQGSAYMHRGEWSRRFVKTVRDNGGLVTAADLAAYQVLWHEPLRTTYRNLDIYTTPGRNYGGIWTLLALKALENADVAKLGHFSKSADALEVMVRTAHQAWAESWIFDYRRLDDRKFVESRLTSAYGDTVWRRVATALPAASRRKIRPHSYHIIVVDPKGNAITGTNTYQEMFPWGPGIFVQGVFLPDIRITLAYPEEVPPGTRRVNGLTMHLVFDRGSLRFATGSIADSILEAAYQWLVNLIDYRMDAAGAVSTPGFGTFPHDVNLAGIDWTRNWLSPKIDSTIVALLEKRGLKFEQKGPLVGTGVDSGLGAVAVVHPDGTVDGSMAPWPGLMNSGK